MSSATDKKRNTKHQYYADAKIFTPMPCTMIRQMIRAKANQEYQFLFRSCQTVVSVNTRQYQAIMLGTQIPGFLQHCQSFFGSKDRAESQCQTCSFLIYVFSHSQNK